MEQANLAIATSSEMGDRWCLPRIHTIQAQLLRAQGEIDAAEANLRKAVEIAADQSARGSQLRAALHLRCSGAIRASGSKSRSARSGLRVVYRRV
jgi:hypothetical protein